MFGNLSSKRGGRGLTLVVVGLFLAVSITAVAGFTAGSNAEAAPVWVSCTPLNVVAYTTRVHVRCVESFSGIQYFATPTSDAANAARILSVLTSAQALGRTVSVLYDPADTSGASVGCAALDCRLILGAGFGQ